MDQNLKENDLWSFSSKSDSFIIALKRYSTYLLSYRLVVEVNLDMNKSGATLAWSYFSKEKPLLRDATKLAYDITVVHYGREMEKLYAYVEDNDLWLHKLPDSKAFARFGKRVILQV